MNKDEIKGGVRYVKGKVEKGAGDVTTDTKWQADGIIDEVAGGAQHLYGRAKEETMTMDKNRAEGLAKEAKGSIKEAIGKLTGSTSTEAEGKAEKIEGKTEAAASKSIDAVKDVVSK